MTAGGRPVRVSGAAPARIAAAAAAFVMLVALGAGIVVPGSSAAADPATQEAAGDRNVEAAASPIRVRTGEHRGYSRLVFDWRTMVDYWLRRQGEMATVVFEEPARFDLSRLGPRPARLIDDIRIERRTGGVEAHLAVPANARVRHFRVGTRVVVDVYAPAKRAPRRQAGAETKQQPDAADPPPEPADPPPAASASEQENDGGDAETAAVGDPDPDAAQADGEAAPRAERGPVSGSDLGAGGAGTMTAPIKQPAAGGDRSAVSSTSTAEREATPATVEATRVAPPPSATAGASAPSPEDRKAKASAVSPSVGSASAGAGSKPAAAQNSELAVASKDDGDLSGRLRFAWRKPTPAAAFRRGSWIWVVFGRPSTADVAALTAAAGGGIGDVEQITDEDATVLRMAADERVGIAIERDGLAWIVDVTTTPTRPARSIAPMVEPEAPAGARLMFFAEDAGSPITITDPAMGDRLIIVPLNPAGHGVAHAYSYPQLQVLATAQGIVIEPRADDVSARTLGSGVEVKAPGGLKVTPVSRRDRIRARIGPSDHLSRVLAAESWTEPRSGVDFATTEAQLRAAAAEATGQRRGEALLKSAQFYLAHGFTPECLGALEIALSENAAMAEMPRFLMLRGVCQLLHGRAKEAETALLSQRLNGSDEADLWRGALQVVRGDPEDATAALMRTGPLALTYPPLIRLPLTELIAQAALAADDAATAQLYVDFLDTTPGEGSATVDSGTVAMLQGHVRRLQGDADGAMAAWTAAVQGADRASAAEAARAAIELKLEQGQITPAEAISSLEGLRFAWRGDQFEFDLLRRLAELHGEAGDQRSALMALREAVTHFPDHPDAGKVSDEMARTFEALYLQGEADALPPVTAIALFDEFRELTPAGKRGDEMIRRLVDRLVAVDLLDRAQELLADQVDHRLTGVEKARVGARLGLLYLLDGEPEKTRDALEASAVAEALPEGLSRQRRQLKARATAELQQFDEALALIAEDDSVDADLIRAEVFWQRKDWRRAGQVFARLMVSAGAKPGAPLDETQARHVLNRAVALALDGDEAGLTRLRRGYGEAMQASTFGDAFRLIAGAEVDSPASLSAVVSADVQRAEGFQAFLAAYRDRLRQGKLSAIN